MCKKCSREIAQLTARVWWQGRFDAEVCGPDVVAVAGRLVAATQALWGRIAPKMLPTPAKFHYLFNMRDISKAHSWDCMALLVAEHVHGVAAAKILL